MIVYDIGAYIGLYSLLAAVSGAEVHAFEPNEDAITRMRNQAMKNGVMDLLTVNEAVVNDIDGQVDLYRDTRATCHSLCDSVTNTEEVVNADSITLNEYCSTRELPDLVKIDVEGAAHKVLAGAESVYTEGQTTWIIEVHNETEREAIDEHFPWSEYSFRWIDDGHVVISP